MTDQPDNPNPTLGDHDAPPEKHDVLRMHEPILREQREPRDGYEPVPLWLVTVFGVLIFWGGWYVASYSGGFRPDMLDENPRALYTRAGEAPRVADPAAMGQRVYLTAGCISCHQANGQGDAGRVPPLAGSEWVLGEPARLKRIVLHGLVGALAVKGAQYNSEMPAFGARLSDQQIAAVLTYIRANPLWQNAAEAISPESVAATRQATKGRTSPFTAAELQMVTVDDYAAPPTQPATGRVAWR